VVIVPQDMDCQTFAIKFLFVQNAIMVLSLGIVVYLLVRALWKKNIRHALVFSVWILIVFWFFNSPFFGFSEVKVCPGGIRLNYGVLSFRNTEFPLHTPWTIKTTLSGVRKTKRLHFLRIGDRESMKVHGLKDLNLLKEVGEAIEDKKRAEEK